MDCLAEKMPRLDRFFLNNGRAAPRPSTPFPNDHFTGRPAEHLQHLVLDAKIAVRFELQGAEDPRNMGSGREERSETSRRCRGLGLLRPRDGRDRKSVVLRFGGPDTRCARLPSNASEMRLMYGRGGTAHMPHQLLTPLAFFDTTGDSNARSYEILGRAAHHP